MSNQAVVHDTTVSDPSGSRERASFPRGRGAIGRVALILAVIGTTLGLGSGNSRASAAVPVATATATVDEVDWLSEILELIRQLYVILGGNIADLDAIDAQYNMQAVLNFYSAHGLPANMSLANRVQALSVIGRLQSLLANPPASQQTSTTAAFSTVIAAIKSLLEIPIDGAGVGIRDISRNSGAEPTAIRAE